MKTTPYIIYNEYIFFFYLLPNEMMYKEVM